MNTKNNRHFAGFLPLPWIRLWADRLPYRMKLILSFWILILAPVMVIGIVSYNALERAIRRNAETSIDAAMRQMLSNVRYKEGLIIRISEQLLFDERIRSFSSVDFSGFDSFVATSTYIIPRLQSALWMTADPVRLKFYVTTRTLPEIYFVDLDDVGRKIDPIARGKKFELFRADRLEAEPWYAGVRRGGNKPVWAQVGDDQTFGNLSLLRDLSETGTADRGAFVRIIVKLEDLYEALDAGSLGAGVGLIYEDYVSGLKYERGGGDASDSFCVTVSDYETGRVLRTIVPNESLYRERDRMRNTIILVCVAVFILVAVVGWLISKRFAIRVGIIVDEIHAFHDGNFHRRIETPGADEFGEIARAFNAMADNTERLINEILEVRLARKETELRLLQSRINPHFLYNALSLIGKLSQSGRGEQARLMSSHLARFYRLTLAMNEAVIPIRDELAQVKAYIEILRIKYMDTIQVIYEVDDLAMERRTVSFILQPFIENAVEHAWDRGTLKVKISVQATGPRIVFTIEDDGIGMSAETLLRAIGIEGEQPVNGIGIVRQRLRMQYGDQSSVSIESDPGKGTKVTITYAENGGSP